MENTFHHSSLDSARIKKVHEFLKARGDTGATTIELTDACGTTRASSDCSELRANGVNVVAEYVGKSDAGRKVWRYKIVRPEPPSPPPEPPRAEFEANFEPTQMEFA